MALWEVPIDLDNRLAEAREVETLPGMGLLNWFKGVEGTLVN